MTSLPDPSTDPSAASGPRWAPGAASGVGSMPGTDAHEAARLVLGELPDLPHLPELPARGPGADLVGRGAGLLVDVHVDRQPSGWRVVDRPGRDERRARSFLGEDLDALEEHAQGIDGPLKLQVAGPWTLAATLELTRGERLLHDTGAVRDLIASLAEGVAAHVGDVARRLPGARLLVQLDEPALPGVLLGRVPTASGYGTLRAVDAPVVRDGLTAVLDAVRAALPDASAPYPLVHCCAPDVPLGLLREAGARGLSLDLAQLRQRDDDAIGEAVEAGAALFLGVLPGSGAGPGDLSDPAATVAPVTALWRRLGLDPALLATSVVCTPSCGCAGASPAYARAALAAVRVAGRRLVDDPEATGA